MTEKQMMPRRRSRTSPLLALLLIAIAAGGIVWWALWGRPGPVEGPHRIVVAQGATLSQVADDLVAKGAVPGTARTYRLMARLFGSDDPVQAGEFAIPPGTTGAGVLDILQHGQPMQRFVTVPEGMPSILVHERLMAEPLLTGSVAVPPEGSVLPDSYSFERGETREAVLQRMRDAMTAALAEEWKKRKKAAVVKSPREALILASIVEKETAVESERRTVAAVYSNRLRIGMRLQADPTTIYPITKGKPLGRRIRRSELDAVNGYNTYAKAGLPVGPIANPGRASIAAVLDPAPSDALYFVADGKGGHVFARTLAEHEANVRKWYAIRRARGEM
jgi:UPF0755 protein